MVHNEIKDQIKKSYGEIAKGNQSIGCCSNTACCSPEQLSTSMTGDYSEVKGYQKEADLALGCGIPSEIANIQEGDTVIDLGAGAGNDVFIARKIVGEKGRVIGVDFTPEMVIRALQNNQKMGFENVEFHLNEIENMNAIESNTADVVISNCVMNLVTAKEKAFSEVFRVLKKGGHFSISDIVLAGELPDKILEAAEMYAGCVAGASEKGQYLGVIKSAGFKNIQIKKERVIELPDDLLQKYLNATELEAYRNSESGVYSITVYAEKLEEGDCCESTEENCCGSDVKTEKESGCCGSGNDSSGCC